MKFFFTAVCLLGAILTAYAGPDAYLRGKEYGNWAADPAYKFTQNPTDVYTLHVDVLQDEFKIGGEEWSNLDYGGGNVITGTGQYTLTPGGGNMSCSTPLQNVDLRFTTTDYGESVLEVAANGDKLPDLPAVVTPGVSGTLPILYINVYTDATKTTLNDEIISKDLSHKNYFSFADYWLDLNGCEWLAAEGAESLGSKEAPLPLEIKARGNYTRTGFSKKPFKLKLGAKQNMLGMSKSKHYTLLAHADDSFGYLRNFVGFNLGKRIGLPWTPWQQPVEVVINGDYRGLYFLTEAIRVEKDRINITELDDNVSDPNLVSGGYVVELDNYDEENQIRMTESIASGAYHKGSDPLRVTFDTPEVYSDIQKRFITDQFTAMNMNIGMNSNDTWSYIDLDDAARYYLVEEIISHVEAYHGSTYLFRDRGAGQKWHFSPLWDCGQAFNGSTGHSFIYDAPYGSTWIPSFLVNGKFNEKVRETWLWFMTNKYAGLEDDINAYATHIAAAAKADHKRWGDAPRPNTTDASAVADNSDMTSKKNTVLNHLNGKLAFLRNTLGDYSALTEPAAEPARDDTPAAPLPSYVGTSVVNITYDAVDTPAEYYDLTGMRITNPRPGSIVIVRQGSVSKKQVVSGIR